MQANMANLKSKSQILSFNNITTTNVTANNFELNEFNNKNQFVLNNCHFVMNENIGQPANNNNYTNVTIWREELNAKNNVQQQIKKQVNFLSFFGNLFQPK